MLVGIGADHARVAIAQELLVDGAAAKGIHRARELGRADLREAGTRLVVIERRVVDLPLGPVRAGHQVDSHTLGHEARDGAAGPHRLVVGVGMDEEDAAVRLHGPMPRCSLRMRRW